MFEDAPSVTKMERRGDSLWFFACLGSLGLIELWARRCYSLKASTAFLRYFLPNLILSLGPEVIISSFTRVCAMANAITTHGWTAIPRDTSALNGKNAGAPKRVIVNDIALPKTPLAKAVLEYARAELREETFNHSMRVYYYGTPDSDSFHLYKC